MILRFGFLFIFVILVLDEGTNVLNRLFSFELENIRWVAYLFFTEKGQRKNRYIESCIRFIILKTDTPNSISGMYLISI